jgi:hypothetical protein
MNGNVPLAFSGLMPFSSDDTNLDDFTAGADKDLIFGAKCRDKKFIAVVGEDNS